MGYKAVTYNPQTETYASFDVSDLEEIDNRQDKSRRRTVKIYLSDGTRIESVITSNPINTEGMDTSKIIQLEIIKVSTPNITVEYFDKKCRVRSNNKASVEAISNPLDSAQMILNQIQILKEYEDLIDPFEIIYGSLSERKIIKKYLGSRRSEIFTTDLPQTTTAWTYDYQEVLDRAQKHLRSKLWEDMPSLAQMLKSKKK